jgi:hypothetical protein
MGSVRLALLVQVQGALAGRFEVTALTLKASAALTGVLRIRRGQDVIVQVAATAGMREEALQCTEADPGGPGSARPALHVDLRRIFQ